MSILKLWLLCTIFLAAKMWANSLVQAYGRFRHQQFVNPEDARLAGQLMGKPCASVTQADSIIERAARCWRNDLENIPMFLLVALGYGLLGGSKGWGAVYLGTFAMVRDRPKGPSHGQPIHCFTWRGYSPGGFWPIWWG